MYRSVLGICGSKTYENCWFIIQMIIYSYCKITFVIFSCHHYVDILASSGSNNLRQSFWVNPTKSVTHHVLLKWYHEAQPVLETISWNDSLLAWFLYIWSVICLYKNCVPILLEYLLTEYCNQFITYPLPPRCVALLLNYITVFPVIYTLLSSKCTLYITNVYFHKTVQELTNNT